MPDVQQGRAVLVTGASRGIGAAAFRGAFRGEPTHPAYGASKAGIIAFGQSLARALAGYGTAVTAVAPGFVETDMAAEELSGEQGARRRAESPFGRVATPDDVAAAVLFLASAQAEMTSGSVLDVNGASYLRM
jgi:3-oxoacyl-[acyl-carrier protein] reductase